MDQSKLFQYSPFTIKKQLVETSVLIDYHHFEDVIKDAKNVDDLENILNEHMAKLYTIKEYIQKTRLGLKRQT